MKLSQKELRRRLYNLQFCSWPSFFGFIGSIYLLSLFCNLDASYDTLGERLAEGVVLSVLALLGIVPIVLFCYASIVVFDKKPHSRILVLASKIYMVVSVLVVIYVCLSF